MGAPKDSSRGPVRERRSRITRWVVISVVVAVIVGSALVALWTLNMSPSSGGTPTYPAVSISLGGLNGSAVTLNSGYLGVNVRADSPLPPPTDAVLNSTGVRMVRWPGGAIADRFDPLGGGDEGVIYNDSGATESPSTSLASFVQWCRSMSCQSIITLPAEIDNTSEALAIVNYTERDLGFRPTYWEVGNEPALWEHFGVPWDQWNTSQALAPTPAQYSSVVGQYVRAIRTVDTETGIIGLGGVGKGSFDQAGWISSVVGPNGANLSAVAIHVYPAGGGFPVDDLSGWFGSLQGPTSLASRVESAATAVEQTCSACHIAVLVDEFQAGTGLTSSTALSGGYLATYIAAEIVQALPLPVRSLEFYDLQSGTPGAWLNAQGSPSDSFELYQALATDLGVTAVQLNVSSSAQGIEACAGGSSGGDLTSLMIANTNATYGARVDLESQFPGAATGTVWSFDGPSSAPDTEPLNSALARNFSIPPGSVVIFRGIGSLVELHHPSPAVPHRGLTPAAIMLAPQGVRSGPPVERRISLSQPPVLATVPARSW